MARWKWPTPIGEFRDFIQNGQRTKIVLQQRSAKIYRVASRCKRHFVHKAFDHENIVAFANPSPPIDRDRTFPGVAIPISRWELRRAC